jgi:DNA-directed RNA polymerase alpha subunit
VTDPPYGINTKTTNRFEEQPINPNWFEEIGYHNCGVRGKRILNSNRCKYLGDLIQKTEKDVLRFVGFGRRTLRIIKEELKNYNLQLNTVIPNWDNLKAKHEAGYDH